MIKLSDYVIDFLVEKNIKNVFLVAGGGIMHLIDSVGKNKNINYIANHHEQASATAAESYSRLTNDIGVCLVTTGPGGTNAITGVAGAWVDSIPMIVISGQVKRELIANYEKVRQIGPQEINIVGMVKGITKYAKTIMEPDTIKYELEKAYFEAKNGRPGPVWLDIPLDVQAAMVDEKKMIGFSVPKIQKNEKELDKKINKVIDLLKKSKRPVIIAGNGIRLSHGNEMFKTLVNKLKVPVLTTVNGLDLIEEKNKYFFGRFGPMGQRRANFVLQNADLVLSVGASLNVSTTGFDFDNFARGAKKISINIDESELTTRKVKIDLSICVDARFFLEKLLKGIDKFNFEWDKRWLKVCHFWKNKYPTVLNQFLSDKNHINSYVFFKELSDSLNSMDVLTTGVGLDVVSFIQSFEVKRNQRAFVNKNFGQMGWDLPAVIGTCVANKFKRVVSVCGDGSFQMNIQELGTISFYKMPIKIFVFNNGGYKTIRDTQNNLFEGRFVGADKKSGVSNPDFRKIADAYKMNYFLLKNHTCLSENIKKVLKQKGPVLCEVNIDFDQQRIPKVSTIKLENGNLVSKPLEDMFPFLSEAEIYANMHMFDEKEI